MMYRVQWKRRTFLSKYFIFQKRFHEQLKSSIVGHTLELTPGSISPKQSSWETNNLESTQRYSNRTIPGVLQEATEILALRPKRITDHNTTKLKCTLESIQSQPDLVNTIHLIIVAAPPSPLKKQSRWTPRYL